MNVMGWSAALALGLQGAAPATAPLAPTGKWQVAFEDDLCAMAHDFGEGPSALTLAFRPFPLNNQMEAVLLLPNKGGARRQGKAKVALQPSGETFDATFDAFATTKKIRVVHVDFDRTVFERLSPANQLTITADGTTFDMALPNTRGARKVLDQCETSLLEEWGVDPALRNQEQAGLRGNPGKFFGPEAYPVAALRAQVGGRVVTLVSVDATGRVSACRVVRTSKVAALDEKTCEIAKQSVRYQPAIGANGKPTASYALLPVRWQLPD